MIRRPRLLALFGVTAILIVACASSASVAPEAASGPVFGSARGAAQAPVAAPAALTDQAANTGFSAVTSAAGSPAHDGSAVDGSLIVKTGNMSLEVKDLDAALSAAQTAIIGLGGYVSGTNATNDGFKAQTTLNFRIPAARWEDALVTLRALGKVTTEQTGAVEVTGQVADLDAQLRNLRSTETALLSVMTKAVKIPDILAVQEQLTNVQGQIEQLTTQRTTLANQAALGSLAVDFSTPAAPVAAATEGWDPGAVVSQALAALIGAGQNLASAGIWLLIVGLPLLVVLLIIGLPTGWLWRRRRHRRATVQTTAEPV